MGTEQLYILTNKALALYHIFIFYSLSLLFLLCRRGHDDLGDHYLDCGDLSNALKCYSRARDYCTSAKHVINMCLNVIKVRRDPLNVIAVNSIPVLNTLSKPFSACPPVHIGVPVTEYCMLFMQTSDGKISCTSFWPLKLFYSAQFKLDMLRTDTLLLQT